MKAVLKAKVQDLKRELILEEASAYFEAVGLEAAKMAEVAARCGISVGALYKVFASKEALFYAYVAHQIARFMQRLEAMTAETTDAREKLRMFARLKFATFCDKAKVIKDPLSGDPLFFTKLNLSHDNPAEPVYVWLAKVFDALLADSEEALRTAYRFNAVLLGEIEYWLLHGGPLVTEAERVVDRFLYGILEKGMSA